MRPTTTESRPGTGTINLQSGPKTGEIWQWRGRVGWLCFSEVDSQRIQNAVLLGLMKLDLWDRGALRSLDFESMRAMPGRQPLRYAKPPPPHEPQIAGGSPKASKNAVEEVSPKTGRAEDQERLLDTTFETASVASTCGEAGGPAGMRSLVHPCFLDLQRPRFNFRGNTAEEDYKHFVWDRKLDDAEDDADFVVCVANIYAEVLADPRTTIELPIFGTPQQTMACLALGLHIAGAIRYPENPKVWRFSIKQPKQNMQEIVTAGSPKQTVSKASSGKGLLPSIAKPSSSSKRASSPSKRPLSRALSETAKSFFTLPRLGSRGANSKSMGSLGMGSTRGSSTGFGIKDIGSMLPSTMKAKPTAVLKQLKQVIIPCCITFRLEETYANRSLSLKMLKYWNQWVDAAATVAAGGPPPVPRISGDYAWLNILEPEYRILRLGVACGALWDASKIRHRVSIADRVSVNSMLRRTNMTRHSVAKKLDLKVMPGRFAYENAMAQLSIGQRCGAAIICQSDMLGAQFFNGNLPGAEEDFCMRSNLYEFIREAAYQAEVNRITDSKGRISAFPEDGVVHCEGVTVFREGRESGFRPMHEPVTIPAVLCLSLVNLNPYKDSTAEARTEIARFDHEVYALTLRKKFEMMLQAAAEANLEGLCVSDQECKKIHNKPVIVGEALGAALVKAKFKLPTVYLSGSSGFITAVRKVCTTADW